MRIYDVLFLYIELLISLSNPNQVVNQVIIDTADFNKVQTIQSVVWVEF